MQEENFETKLSSWINFRKRLETSATPFEDVIKHYNTLNKCKLSVDPWDQKTWPDPWELLCQNKICDFTNSLGVCYSLQLTDRFSQSKFEIHICTDTINDEVMYPVIIDDQYVLCYKLNEVCQKAELPSNIVSQRIYPMIPLQ